MIKPGLFGKQAAADNRRMDFDFGNEQLLYLKKKIDFLFIGDSITQLWDIPAYVGTEFYIVNRAAGGDTSYYLNKRFEADCIQLHPQRCILLIGANDISEADSDAWWRTPGRPANEVFADYCRNINEIIDKCRRAGIALTLSSVLPSDIAPPFDKELHFEMTSRMNAYLQAAAAQNHLDYLDYFSSLCLSDKKKIRPELTPDGVHPNAEGYQIMADILLPYLKNRSSHA